ncbi:TOBE domain-containing protein [Nonomuraea sediminis]|uniref:TOBE domain-containing protein n=1 Tax=Nonomuraea sediminis TaxID=2835864 RepID=UPI001BDC3D8E|nr:TOBE domain-containing protein [Nonomuraea sediminis]
MPGKVTGRDRSARGQWSERSEDIMRLSARNQIPARVTGITKGEATANVELDAAGVRLMASITVEAAEELGLRPGSELLAVIKASDVMLAVDG